MPTWKPRTGSRFLSAAVACTFTVASALAGDEPPKTDPCADALPFYVKCAGTTPFGNDETGIRIAFSGGETTTTFSADDADLAGRIEHKNRVVEGELDPEECSPTFTIRPGESATCATQASVFDAYKIWARASAVAVLVRRVNWKNFSFHSKRYPEHETLGYTMVWAAAHADWAMHSWEDFMPSTWILLDDGQLYLPVFEPFGVRWTDRGLTVRDVGICLPQAVPDATETLTDPPQGCRSLGQRIRERAPLAASDEEFEDKAFSYLSGLLALVFGPGELTKVSAALLRSGIVVHPVGSLGFLPPRGHDGAVWYESRPVYRPLLLRREEGQMFLRGFFRHGGDYYDVELTLNRRTFHLKVEHVGSHVRSMLQEI